MSSPSARPVELLRSPLGDETWTAAGGPSASGATRAAQYRIARALDAGAAGVEARITALLAGEDAASIVLAAGALAASDLPSEAPAIVALIRHLEHPDARVAHEVAFAFYARARRGRPMGPAFPTIAHAQLRPELSDVCALTLDVSASTNLEESHFSEAIPALLETEHIRWESLRWLREGAASGRLPLTPELLDGPLGDWMFFARERGEAGAELWKRAIDEGVVDVERVVARVGERISAVEAGLANDGVRAVGHLARAGVPLTALVSLLEAALAHPKRGPHDAARTLIGRVAKSTAGACERLESAAEAAGARAVLDAMPRDASASTLGVDACLDLLKAKPTSRGAAAKAEHARRRGQAIASLIDSLLEPDTRDATVTKLSSSLASRTRQVGVGAGHAAAKAWLQVDEARFESLLREGGRWAIVGAFEALSALTAERARLGRREWRLGPSTLDAIAAAHRASDTSICDAAWDSFFPGDVALRDGVLRAGRAHPLVLVGGGVRRGRALSVTRLKRQLSHHPESLDVCLPQIAYALHGAARHDVVTAVSRASAALEASGEPAAVAKARDAWSRLLPLLFGVLLDRDYAGALTDQATWRALERAFDLGVEVGALWTLASRDPSAPGAVRALVAARRSSEAVLTAGLIERLEACLGGLEITLEAHPASRMSSLERAHSAARLLTDLRAP